METSFDRAKEEAARAEPQRPAFNAAGLVANGKSASCVFMAAGLVPEGIKNKLSLQS